VHRERGILFIANAVLSGGGWLVPTAVIAGTGVIMAGIMILNGKKSDVSIFKP
jgi:hypothetical protein